MNNGGFTLMELLVALVIFGILSAAFLGQSTQQLAGSSQAELQMAGNILAENELNRVLARKQRWTPRVLSAGKTSAFLSQVAFTPAGDRIAAGDKEKTGVFTGAYAINPVNDQPVPIWVADYVLASYGTGAIMAVPASDTRDFEFACAFDLPIVAGRGAHYPGRSR